MATTTVDLAHLVQAEPLDEALRQELERARHDINEAQGRLKLLLAYAREFQGRRPLPLRWLADAAGMSHTHVRTAYGPDDISRVVELLEQIKARGGAGVQPSAPVLSNPSNRRNP